MFCDRYETITLYVRNDNCEKQEFFSERDDILRFTVVQNDIYPHIVIAKTLPQIYAAYTKELGKFKVLFSLRACTRGLK